MHEYASPAKGAQPVTRGLHRGRGTYTKVFGPGKRRIRGLWKCNGAFYAQLTLTGPDGKKSVRRVRLEDKDGTPVDTLAAAIKAMASMTTKRDEATLELTPKRTPTFADAAQDYIEWLQAVGDVKRPKTVYVERNLLEQFKRWGAWKASVEGKASAADTLCTLRTVVECVRDGLSKTGEIVDHLKESVRASERTVKRLLAQAVKGGYLTTLTRGRYAYVAVELATTSDTATSWIVGFGHRW